MKLASFALALTVAGAFSSPIAAKAETIQDYTPMANVMAIYNVLNSVTTVSLGGKRHDETKRLQEKVECRNMVQVKKKLGTDANGYVRVYKTETPYEECLRYALSTTWQYPQALIVPEKGDATFKWDSASVNISNAAAQACGTTNDRILELVSAQGRSLNDGTEEKTIVRILTKGAYSLPTGEKAIAMEYTLDNFSWRKASTQSSGGWGETPLVRWLTGKGGGGSILASGPQGNIHSREYAQWFAVNQPKQTLCKFLIVDLSQAPRYQDKYAHKSEPSWQWIGR